VERTHKLFLAFCCRKGILKTVLQSTPEYAIFRQKIQKFSGDQTLPQAGGDSLPHLPPLGAYGASILAPSALAIYLVGSIFGLF